MNAMVVQRMMWVCLILGGPGLSGICAGAAPSAEELEKIKAAIPERATAKPKQPRKVLVFSISWGYRHSSIPYGKAAIAAMAEKTGAFEATVSDDLIHFEPANLKRYDAVVFNNTNNEIFLPQNFKKLKGDVREKALETDKRLKQSFTQYLASGKGLMVIHAGVASFRQWPEYGKIIGARFDNHPWNAGSKVKLWVEDPRHILTRGFAQRVTPITEEIYQFKAYSRKDLRVLVRVDTKNTPLPRGIHRKDGDFPVAWIKHYGKGRVFYGQLGHQHEIFWNPTVMRLYLDGIQYALGDLDAKADPIPLKADDGP